MLQSSRSSRLSEASTFDLATQVAILRRAVAEILIPRSASSAHLKRTAGDLAVHGVLAQVTLSSPELSAWAARDRDIDRAKDSAEGALLSILSRLETAQSRAPSYAVIELQRRKLHGALARLGKVLASRDNDEGDALSELELALSMRRAVSDLQDAMLAETTARENLPWALVVADTELSILLDRPAVVRGPEREKAELRALHARVVAARRGSRQALAFSKLYADVVRPNVLGSLSRRREVRRHDELALQELAKLLTRRFPDLTLASVAADNLCNLRGMDGELDRLIAELPFDPAQVLGSITRRVGELRACALAS